MPNTPSSIFFERLWLGLVLILVAALAVAFAMRSRPKTGPRFDRVITVVLENEDAEEVIKDPFFQDLASQGARLTNFTAESHPSQPNYLALTAAETFGVHDDENVDLPANHIGDLLEQKRRDWKVYAEDYPGACFLGLRQGAYVRKHTPMLSFQNVQTDPERCAKVQGFTHFDQDLQADRLPDYVLIIPNLNHDGHDTNLATSAQWMKEFFVPLLSRPELKKTLFIVTYDENEHMNKENRIYTVLLGQPVLADISSDSPSSHYSLLHLIEEEWDLGFLNANDRNATDLRSLLR